MRVSPFTGIYYNPKKLPNLSDLITPPYDVISKSDEKKYFERSPYNFAHLILAKKENEDYKEAAALLKKWKDLEILKKDTGPAYYLYRQTFTARGETHTRDTLMAAVELHDFSDGVIRPHENTHGKYKADRLLKLRSTQHNLSHIFGMVKDSEGFLSSTFEQWVYKEPLLKATGNEGVENTVWRMDAPEIAEFFESRPIYIVDGHHRYESSLTYAREQNALHNPKHPASRMLFAIANCFDPGLVVFATHRFVTGIEKPLEKSLIEKKFELQPMEFSTMKTWLRTPKDSPQFGLFFGGNLYVAQPKDWTSRIPELGKSVAKLSVTWSDHGFLTEFCGIDDTNRTQRVSYKQDPDDLWEKRGQANAIIFHAPPRVTDVTEVADEKRFMPQKSTFFYPKLAAGLILRDCQPLPSSP